MIETKNAKIVTTQLKCEKGSLHFKLYFHTKLNDFSETYIYDSEEANKYYDTEVVLNANVLTFLLEITDYSTWENLTGKFVRIKHREDSKKVLAIGHLLEENWLTISDKVKKEILEEEKNKLVIGADKGSEEGDYTATHTVDSVKYALGTNKKSVNSIKKSIAKYSREQTERRIDEIEENIKKKDKIKETKEHLKNLSVTEFYKDFHKYYGHLKESTKYQKFLKQARDRDLNYLSITKYGVVILSKDFTDFLNSKNSSSSIKLRLGVKEDKLYIYYDLEKGLDLIKAVNGTSKLICKSKLSMERLGQLAGRYIINKEKDYYLVNLNEKFEF